MNQLQIRAIGDLGRKFTQWHAVQLRSNQAQRNTPDQRRFDENWSGLLGAVNNPNRANAMDDYMRALLVNRLDIKVRPSQKSTIFQPSEMNELKASDGGAEAILGFLALCYLQAFKADNYGVFPNLKNFSIKPAELNGLVNCVIAYWIHQDNPTQEEKSALEDFLMAVCQQKIEAGGKQIKEKMHALEGESAQHGKIYAAMSYLAHYDSFKYLSESGIARTFREKPQPKIPVYMGYTQSFTSPPAANNFKKTPEKRMENAAFLGSPFSSTSTLDELHYVDIDEERPSSISSNDKTANLFERSESNVDISALERELARLQQSFEAFTKHGLSNATLEAQIAQLHDKIDRLTASSHHQPKVVAPESVKPATTAVEEELMLDTDHPLYDIVEKLKGIDPNKYALNADHIIKLWGNPLSLGSADMLDWVLGLNHDLENIHDSTKTFRDNVITFHVYLKRVMSFCQQMKGALETIKTAIDNHGESKGFMQTPTEKIAETEILRKVHALLDKKTTQWGAANNGWKPVQKELIPVLEELIGAIKKMDIAHPQPQVINQHNHHAHHVDTHHTTIIQQHPVATVASSSSQSPTEEGKNAKKPMGKKPNPFDAIIGEMKSGAGAGKRKSLAIFGEKAKEMSEEAIQDAANAARKKQNYRQDLPFRAIFSNACDLADQISMQSNKIFELPPEASITVGNRDTLNNVYPAVTADSEFDVSESGLTKQGAFSPELTSLIQKQDKAFTAKCHFHTPLSTQTDINKQNAQALGLLHMLSQMMVEIKKSNNGKDWPTPKNPLYISHLPKTQDGVYGRYVLGALLALGIPNNCINIDKSPRALGIKPAKFSEQHNDANWRIPTEDQLIVNFMKTVDENFTESHVANVGEHPIIQSIKDYMQRNGEMEERSDTLRV